RGRSLMVKRARFTAFPTLGTIQLQPETDAALYKQLYEALRAAILQGELAAETRLPSTRLLADELSVSRNTVVNAFDQLLAEGYLESRVGDGTYVAHILPDEFLRVGAASKTLLHQRESRRGLSRRGKFLSQTAVSAKRHASGSRNRRVQEQA